MAEEENCEWIFVHEVPLLCDKKRIEKQQKIETWLDLYQITRELGLQKTESTHGAKTAFNYVS